jgi:hypothetical protein
MSMQPDPPDDERDALYEDDFEPDDFPTVDGAYSDESADPAMAPVIEAGGGVSEGFEQSEALLVEHASEGGVDGTMLILRDAGAPEPEPDPAVYGDADHERSSERDTDD